MIIRSRNAKLIVRALRRRELASFHAARFWANSSSSRRVSFSASVGFELVVAGSSGMMNENSANPMPIRRKLAAHILPMLLFIAFLALNAAVRKIDNRIWTSPEFWIYPIQTLLCAALLIWFHREYEVAPPRRLGFAVLVGVVVFVLWISPQAFLGAAPRAAGFNPDLIGTAGAYWPELILRFVRLVAVVPFIEEIFWRGFLLRFFIDDNFDRVRFGTFSWPSFTIVTLGFALSHSPADWIAALFAGALYNAVGYRTKSLSACIFAHALTNLLLGLWIMQTKQWGFW
jgi:uncharacterized protein